MPRAKKSKSTISSDSANAHAPTKEGRGNLNMFTLGKTVQDKIESDLASYVATVENLGIVRQETAKLDTILDDMAKAMRELLGIETNALDNYDKAKSTQDKAHALRVAFETGDNGHAVLMRERKRMCVRAFLRMSDSSLSDKTMAEYRTSIFKLLAIPQSLQSHIGAMVNTYPLCASLVASGKLVVGDYQKLNDISKRYKRPDKAGFDALVASWVETHGKFPTLTQVKAQLSASFGVSDTAHDKEKELRNDKRIDNIVESVLSGRKKLAEVKDKDLDEVQGRIKDTLNSRGIGAPYNPIQTLVYFNKYYGKLIPAETSKDKLQSLLAQTQTLSNKLQSHLEGKPPRTGVAQYPLELPLNVRTILLEHDLDVHSLQRMSAKEISKRCKGIGKVTAEKIVTSVTHVKA